MTRFLGSRDGWAPCQVVDLAELAEMKRPYQARQGLTGSEKPSEANSERADGTGPCRVIHKFLFILHIPLPPPPVCSFYFSLLPSPLFLFSLTIFASHTSFFPDIHPPFFLSFQSLVRHTVLTPDLLICRVDYLHSLVSQPFAISSSSFFFSSTKTHSTDHQSTTFKMLSKFMKTSVVLLSATMATAQTSSLCNPVKGQSMFDSLCPFFIFILGILFSLSPF